MCSLILNTPGHAANPVAFPCGWDTEEKVSWSTYAVVGGEPDWLEADLAHRMRVSSRETGRGCCIGKCTWRLDGRDQGDSIKTTGGKLHVASLPVVWCNEETGTGRQPMYRRHRRHVQIAESLQPLLLQPISPLPYPLHIVQCQRLAEQQCLPGSQ